MSYVLRYDRLYMMPTHFGPHAGPRQRPDGGRWTEAGPARVRRVSFNFLTSVAALAELLPSGFEPAGDPVATLDFGELRDIPWLAGRGYDTLGFRCRARYRGPGGPAEGPFLFVLWENLADPILTGREQLGYNKIYADLEARMAGDDAFECAASWMGFRFLQGRAGGWKPVPPAQAQARMAQALGDGVLHYKYVPRTGDGWREADASYVTLSPAPGPQARPSPSASLEVGEGRFEWSVPSWEQMPTQQHIVSRLAQLEVLRWLPATRVVTLELTDYREQRILA